MENYVEIDLKSWHSNIGVIAPSYRVPFTDSVPLRMPMPNGGYPLYNDYLARSHLYAEPVCHDASSTVSYESHFRPALQVLSQLITHVALNLQV